MRDAVQRLHTLNDERPFRLGIIDTTMGGLLTAAIVSSGGASNFLQVAITAYSNPAKKVAINFYGKPDAGWVSAEGAVSMASNLRDEYGLDLVLAETGIAPTTRERRSDKPSGVSYLAVMGSRGHAYVDEFHYAGNNREKYMCELAQFALDFLLQEAGNVIPE